MARPQSGMETSHLPKLKVFRPISDQTYYLYFRKLVRAFQQWEAAKEVGEEKLVEENARAIAAIQLRLRDADRPSPTYKELVEQGKIKKREEAVQTSTNVTFPVKPATEPVDVEAYRAQLRARMRELDEKSKQADQLSQNTGE